MVSEERIEYLEILENLTKNCEDDPLLRDLTEVELEPLAKTIQISAVKMHEHVCESLDMESFGILNQSELVDEEGERENALGSVIFDTLWKATFQED